MSSHETRVEWCHFVVDCTWQHTKMFMVQHWTKTRGIASLRWRSFYLKWAIGFAGNIWGWGVRAWKETMIWRTKNCAFRTMLRMLQRISIRNGTTVPKYFSRNIGNSKSRSPGIVAHEKEESIVARPTMRGAQRTHNPIYSRHFYA
jgi:hypothetical protein